MKNVRLNVETVFRRSRFYQVIMKLGLLYRCYVMKRVYIRVGGKSIYIIIYGKFEISRQNTPICRWDLCAKS